VSREAIYDRSTVVIYAAHVNATIEELGCIDRRSPPDAALMLDVSSVKAPIVRAARGLRNFVASHAMAGSERSGAGAASAGLFLGKPWLYVPTRDEELDERAVRFIGALGGIPVEAYPDKHDETVALTSHLPQVLANIFAARLRERGPLAELEPFCGPTARELLRLSRSSTAMWHDILQTNGKNVAAELHAFASDLQRTANELDKP
jgi:prephenate dehydrogenase